MADLPKQISTVNRNSTFSPSIELGRLWENTSAKGVKYLAGRLGSAKIAILPIKDPEPGQPTHRIMVSEPVKRDGGDS